MQIEQLKTFELTTADADLVGHEFTLLLADCRLSELTATECRAKLPAQSGCYLWIMCLDSSRYKIYVGQTRSILKRVTDYSRGFQIHSPNDYKLRFFEEAMRETFPQGTLDLYFAAMKLDDCQTRETELVRHLAPLINTLPVANEQERGLIRDAFRAYYRSSVARRLSQGYLTNAATDEREC
jgi:hypothetical protein